MKTGQENRYFLWCSCPWQIFFISFSLYSHSTIDPSSLYFCSVLAKTQGLWYARQALGYSTLSQLSLICYSLKAVRGQEGRQFSVSFVLISQRQEIASCILSDIKEPLLVKWVAKMMGAVCEVQTLGSGNCHVPLLPNLMVSMRWSADRGACEVVPMEEPLRKAADASAKQSISMNICAWVQHLNWGRRITSCLSVPMAECPNWEKADWLWADSQRNASETSHLLLPKNLWVNVSRRQCEVRVDHAQGTECLGTLCAVRTEVVTQHQVSVSSHNGYCHGDRCSLGLRAVQCLLWRVKIQEHG